MSVDQLQTFVGLSREERTRDSDFFENAGERIALFLRMLSPILRVREQFACRNSPKLFDAISPCAHAVAPLTARQTEIAV